MKHFFLFLVVPVMLSGCMSFGHKEAHWDMQTTRPRDELAACVATKVANGIRPQVEGDGLVVTSVGSIDPPRYFFVSSIGVDGLPRTLITITKQYNHPLEDLKVLSCLPDPALPRAL